ncbi:hypothetical protein [Amycolatopsis sp. DSM 110486]|uniref:hypothetical protein n=1 Tax=Amycolatopsis sp. DSM 110486 TaxID=2865832 RepID=UPI00210326F7|nr:hypothetical protein [Amycolatopsis sp. DSM 110486]
MSDAFLELVDELLDEFFDEADVARLAEPAYEARRSSPRASFGRSTAPGCHIRTVMLSATG